MQLLTPKQAQEQAILICLGRLNITGMSAEEVTALIKSLAQEVLHQHSCNTHKMIQ